MDRAPTKTCPACGSSDYAFRGRKTVAAEPGTGGGQLVETKYRCKACSHEWRVQAPAPGTPGSC